MLKNEPGSNGKYGIYGPAPGPMYFAPVPGRTLADVRINSLGLRDREYSKEKPKGTFRIVMLGDSVAFGAGCPQEADFESLLEQGMAVDGYNVEVLNLGVPGYNVVMEAGYLAYKGLALKPDLVLVVIGPNDLTETPVVLFEKNRMRLLFRIDVARDGIPWSFSLPFGIDRWLMVNSALARRLFRLFASPGTRMYKRLEEENKQAMIKIDRLAHGVGARVVFILMPEMRELNPYPLQDTHDRMMEYLTKNGESTIDLLPLIRKVAGHTWKDLRLSPNDTIHPNIKGHKLVAGILKGPIEGIVANMVEKHIRGDGD